MFSDCDSHSMGLPDPILVSESQQMDINLGVKLMQIL